MFTIPGPGQPASLGLILANKTYSFKCLHFTRTTGPTNFCQVLTGLFSRPTCNTTHGSTTLHLSLSACLYICLSFYLSICLSFVLSLSLNYSSPLQQPPPALHVAPSPALHSSLPASIIHISIPIFSRMYVVEE